MLRTRIGATVSAEARALFALMRAGALGLETPKRSLEIVRAMRDYGALGGAARIAALRHADLPAVADERGEITFAELDAQVNRLSNAFCSHGLGAGATVGILCRNHRAPLITSFAASRLGMNAVWLNTAFSARQASEVADREGVDLLVHDAELAEVAEDTSPAHGRIATSITTDDAEFDELIASGSPTPPAPPSKPGRLILLTSGTTGTPKGAPRPEPRSLTIPGGLLERMPMRAREATVVAPPLFHGTGLGIALLTISLGSKLVLRPRFDPAQFIDDLERHRATGACVVPVMLQRVLALGQEEINRRDLSRLKVVLCAGSRLPAEVAIQSMDLLGDVIYNMYGSTEVSVATLATPADIRAAPTSVGKPTLGSRVKILGERGHPVPVGETGRIFVGTSSPFEGYTGGGAKEIVDGLLSTGDVGYLDDDGRLHIDGRDDDMIVSGGENVFPREVEDLLLTHPAIAEAAVIGVDDAGFGQRLKAFVVRRTGAEVTGEEIQAFVKGNLARYKVPRDVVFLAEMPRNAMGKVLNHKLAGHVT